MHPEVKQAIMDAVKDNGGSESVANQLIAWFENVIAGNESLENPTKFDERLGLILKAMPEPITADSDDDSEEL